METNSSKERWQRQYQVQGTSVVFYSVANVLSKFHNVHLVEIPSQNDKFVGIKNLTKNKKNMWYVGWIMCTESNISGEIIDINFSPDWLFENQCSKETQTWILVKNIIIKILYFHFVQFFSCSYYFYYLWPVLRLI